MVTVLQTAAQSRDQQNRMRVDSVLAERYYRTPYDTNYVSRPEGRLTLKVVNLAGYYTFNHRRFSFPAAFTQSYIQHRSADSWLAGISYQGGSINTSNSLKANNFSSRYFASATLVMNNSIFDDDAVVVNQNKWRARASLGMRL